MQLETTTLIRVKEEMKLAEMVDATDKKIKVPQLRVVHDVSTYETGVSILLFSQLDICNFHFFE